ncbi:MAG: hypothetical protein M1827_005315 [Pycnora praestabilis]|nr:MAG: hypothetical protein M1827_005315 [Pycnora praestabilis]
MKILETQSATLTNYEVLTHLQSMRERYSKPSINSSKFNGAHASTKSDNLETVIKELIEYLQPPPSPLHSTQDPSQSPTYTPATIPDLLTALKPYDLTKAELLMILNLRPDGVGVLDCVVEEMEIRLDEGKQEEILRIVGDVLGREKVVDGEGEEGMEEGADVVEANAG